MRPTLSELHLSAVRLAEIGSCQCGSKTSDVEFHDRLCSYRLLSEVGDYLNVDGIRAAVETLDEYSDLDYLKEVAVRAREVLSTVEIKLGGVVDSGRLLISYKTSVALRNLRDAVINE
jgi:hypothetical protein